MARVILLCGRICSGKSTYARRLCAETGAVALSVDEIMLALFGPDAGEKHDEYAARTEAYLLEKSLALTAAGVDVVLDWGFWGKASRAEARAFFASRGVACEMHYLDVGGEVWRRRLEKRNRQVLTGEASAYWVDEALARKAASLFEAPDESEIDVWVCAGAP